VSIGDYRPFNRITEIPLKPSRGLDGRAHLEWVSMYKELRGGSQREVGVVGAYSRTQQSQIVVGQFHGTAPRSSEDVIGSKLFMFCCSMV
jgi:hypothetical protein